MRIVISGATGFVGKNLIPILEAKGAKLLLVGRTIHKLVEAYPQCECCTYKDVETRGFGYDVFVHLATVNNAVKATYETYRQGNIELTLSVAHAANKSGISRFINISSIHALDLENASFYARSKRIATSELAQIPNFNTSTVYLPLVYGDSWAGKLAFLNKLPTSIAMPLFRLFAAMKPSVHVKKLAEYITQPPDIPPEWEIILADNQDENAVYRTLKRAIDLLFALSVGILFGWTLVLIGLAIRADSKGSAFFAQQRVGKDRHLFTCYKLRTMRTGTAHAGTHEIASAAVTRIGKFLRKTKLDELPQFWNVLRNEISLVGPRPCLPVQATLIDARNARGIFAMKPGITGLAQINGVDMSDPGKLTKLEARYFSLRSIILDLKIIVATATGKGQGDRVKGHNRY